MCKDNELINTVEQNSETDTHIHTHTQTHTHTEPSGFQQ
jgi:hypothetical protein